MKKTYFLIAILISLAIVMYIIQNKVVVHEQIMIDQESETSCPY